MKRVVLTGILFLIFSSNFALAQSTEADSTQKPETFETEWNGEKLTMQKYFIVFLKTGPERSQPMEVAQDIQKKHLAYLGGLYEKGFITLNGPSGGEGDIRGFSVYTVATMDKARELAEQDPAVKAGRLVVEVHPWWLAKGMTVK